MPLPPRRTCRTARGNSNGIHSPNTPHPNPQYTAPDFLTTSSPSPPAPLPAYQPEVYDKPVQCAHPSAPAASYLAAPDQNTTRDSDQYCDTPDPNSATTDRSNSNSPTRETHPTTTSSPPNPHDLSTASDRIPDHRACAPTHRAPNPTPHPTPSNGVVTDPNSCAEYQLPKPCDHYVGPKSTYVLDRAKSPSAPTPDHPAPYPGEKFCAPKDSAPSQSYQLLVPSHTPTYSNRPPKGATGDIWCDRPAVHLAY